MDAGNETDRIGQTSSPPAPGECRKTERAATGPPPKSIALLWHETTASNRPSWPDVRQLAHSPISTCCLGRIAPLAPPCRRLPCRTADIEHYDLHPLEGRALVSQPQRRRTSSGPLLSLHARGDLRRRGAASPAMALSAKKQAVIKIIKTEARKKHLSKAADHGAPARSASARAATVPRHATHSCKGLFQLKTAATAAASGRTPRGTPARRFATSSTATAPPRAALRHSYRYGWY